jgi:hypothetical protein
LRVVMGAGIQYTAHTLHFGMLACGVGDGGVREAARAWGARVAMRAGGAARPGRGEAATHGSEEGVGERDD